MRTLPRTTHAEEEQGLAIQHRDRGMHLERTMWSHSNPKGDHDQPIDEDRSRGVIQQDVGDDRSPRAIHTQRLVTAVNSELQQELSIIRVIDLCPYPIGGLVLE